MLCVVAPVLHKYEVANVEVKVTEPPVQKVVEPLAVMFAVGKGFTVTAVAAEVPPQVPVVVTVKLPLVVTVMLCVVAPVLHK